MATQKYLVILIAIVCSVWKAQARRFDVGLPLWLACSLQVDFIREGCGPDNICQSNLKMSHQFGTRPSTSDLFTPLLK